MTKIKVFLSHSFGYFLTLVLIGSLSYLFTTSALGFYWDDWQAVFLYKTESFKELLAYFSYDRPVSAWTYWVTFPWMPMTPIAWQILTVITRAAAVWFLTKSFILLWPGHVRLLQWYGVLLLVFPSFNMQSISVAFNQHFLTMLLFSFSIYAMIKSIQTSTPWRWVWGLASITSGAGHMVTMEYFAGLEALRPFFIWIALNNKCETRSWNQRLGRTAIYWMPYLLLMAGYLYWRLKLYPMVLGADPLESSNAPVLLYELTRQPGKTLITLANLALQDSIHLITQSWLVPLQTSMLRVDATFNLFSWIVGLAAAALFGIRAAWQFPKDENTAGNRFKLQAGIVGVSAVLLGGLPVWLMNRQALEGKWSERFTLAPMIGAVLLLVVLVAWFVENRRKQHILFIVVLGLSIAYQMQITHKYALDWKIQQDYYWQLAWRVPAIKPDTAFFSANVPSSYTSHHSAGFAMDILYGGETLSRDLATWYFRPDDEGIFFAALAPDQPIKFKLRSIGFEGSTSHALGIQNQASSVCLLILDEIYMNNPLMDSSYEKILPLSNVDQIDLTADPIQPDPLIFGKEPDHDWCYYFQKADLARQQRDWDGVYGFMDEAFSTGLTPKHSLEYTPLLEAQYNRQDWDGVLETSRKMVAFAAGQEKYVCSLWQRLEESTGVQPPQDIADEMTRILDCSQPFPVN